MNPAKPLFIERHEKPDHRFPGRNPGRKTGQILCYKTGQVYLLLTVHPPPPLRAEIHRVDSSLRKEIQEVKVDLLKWTFAFWVGAIAILSGIMFTLLRSFPPK